MILNPDYLPLAKIPVSTLIAIGISAAMAIVSWSFMNWRAAVKSAFVLAIFEGAIRKWGLENGQELVYFGKDMFLIGAYIRFYLSPDPEIRAFRLASPGTLILWLCVIISFAAFQPNVGHPILSFIGLKGYFMYIPLAFMMPYLFRSQEELVRQLTYYALVATPVCILGFLQWKSDKFSVLNTFAAGMAETGGTGFGFGDRVRVTGTFSYISGHATFIVIFTTLHLALLMCHQSKLMRIWLIANLPLLAANGFMNGSRATIYGMVIVGAGFVLASLSTKIAQNQARVMANLVAVGLIVAVGASFWFVDAFKMWQTRATHSGDSFESRVIDQAQIAMELAFNQVGIVGYGMGTTMAVTAQLRNALALPSPPKPPPMMDHELMQVVVELGLIAAALWYAVRIIVFAHSIKMFRASPPSDLRAIVLAGVLVQIPYFYASVVLNHTANILIWGFTGLTFIPALQPAVMRRHQGVPQHSSPPTLPSMPATAIRGSKAPRTSKSL